jgi:hypothetical protein
MNLSGDEFVRAIVEAMESSPDSGPDGAYTSEELKSRLDSTGLHIGHNRIRKILGQLKAKGHVKRVTVSRPNLAGHDQPRPAYMLVSNKETADDK